MCPWPTARYATSALVTQHLTDFFVDFNKRLLCHLLFFSHLTLGYRSTMPTAILDTCEANTLHMCIPSRWPCSQALPNFPSLSVWKSGEKLVSFLMWALHNPKMVRICRTDRLRFTYIQPTTPSTLCVYDSWPPMRVVSYIIPWLSLLFWA